MKEGRTIHYDIGDEVLFQERYPVLKGVTGMVLSVHYAMGIWKYRVKLTYPDNEKHAMDEVSVFEFEDGRCSSVIGDCIPKEENAVN